MKITDILKELEEEESKDKESQQLSYKMIFFKYSQKWYWFAIGLFVCLSIAFAYTYFTTSQYEIKSTLLLRDENKGSDFNSNAALSNIKGFGSSSSVENEAEVLRAEHLMLKASDELGFSVSFSIPNGPFRWKEIYGDEVPFQIVTHERNESFNVGNNTINILIKDDEEYQLIKPSGDTQVFKFGQKLSNFYGSFTIVKNPKFNHLMDGIFDKPIKIEFLDSTAGRHLSKSLSVEIVNKLASVIQLSILSEHPIKGRDLLAKLIEVYNREADDEKNITAKNTITFIDEQLVGLIQELGNIENKAEQYKLSNSITDVGAEAQLYLNSTTVNRQQLAELSIQIDVLESIETYMSRNGNEYETVPGTLTVSDPTLNSLISDFNRIQQERERMLRTTQPNNPIVINISQQLSSLRNSIIENLRHIKNGLIISKNSLQSTSNQFQSRASKVPTMEKELLDINREQGIKQQHYLLLVQKREEAVLTLAAASVGNSKTIEEPIPSEYPVKPNKKIIMAFGLIMGMAIPFGMLFIKDQWQERIQFKSEVEKITKTPILGEISRNKPSDGIIAISKSKRNLIAEQFRFIRSNLAFSSYKKPNQTILVTSGLSGEGKTFFSVNLAITMGLSGKSVVILEFDLRRPAMISALGMKAEKGISEYLNSADMKIEEIIQPMVNAEMVDIIGSGSIPENPAELMINEKLYQLIEILSKSYDHIIIDSAPIGLVSDSFMLANVADITIMLLRYNYSTKSQIKIIEELRKQKKFKQQLLVLNDAKPEMIYGYGAKNAAKYYQQS
ncbi:MULTISPECIES: GumC family protein [Rhodonellum]|nr:MULTISPECIES: tyrosine-protein kinase [Rhodonellum]